MKITSLIITYLFVFGTVRAQLPCGQSIDFNTWSQEGDIPSGQWNVTSGGNSVEQTINGASTWFISPNDFFNVIIQGTIQVNTAADDDLVGFVFGYQNPIGTLTNPSSTYLKSYFFDWKQTTQTFVGLTSNEGFALYEIDGFFDFTNLVVQGTAMVNPPLWQRTNSPIVTLLDTDYSNNGWNDFQQYNFQLKYTADSIVIWIDNQVVFEESGCFEPGRFGFYNQSQDNVIYSNFSYNIQYDFDVSDSILCINDSVYLQIGAGCSQTFSPSVTFDWYFGDNTTAAGIDPSHLYSTSGSYDIELVASDNFGCVDTSTQSIQIFDYTISNAGIDDTSCTLSYNLTALPSSGVWSGPPGVIFSSINSSNTQVSVPSPGLYSFIWEATNAGGCNSTDTVDILFNEYSLFLVLTEPECNSGNDGEVQISLLGGSGSYFYQWGASSNNQTTNPATNLSAGTHTVSIIDSYGCELDSTFSLGEPSTFNLTINEFPSDCELNSGSVSITNLNGGSGGYMFDWGNGLTSNSSIQNLWGGNYSVMIVDSNDCDTLIYFNIPINPFNAQIDSINHVSCFGEMDGGAAIEEINTQIDYFYQWDAQSGSQTTSMVSGLGAGTYNVIVSTNTGCIDTLSVAITEPAQLTINQITNLSGCLGDTVILNANVSGGIPPYSYNWGNGIGAIQNPEVIVSQSQQFSLTVTDSNGCSISDTASVDVVISPLASFTVDILSSCLSDNQEFTFYNTSTPSGLTVNWDFGDQSFANGDTVSHIYSTSGTYSIILSISNSAGCFDSHTESNLINIYPDPFADFSFMPTPVTVLNSNVQFTDLSYSDINNWEWTFGLLGSSNDQAPTFLFPQTAGEHLVSLEVINIYGCTDSISKQIIILDNINIFVPNTFTPDGDEFNQYWMIYATGIDIYETEVIVYNRWGEQIWKTLDINVPWDGTYMGKLVPDGIYTWIINTKSVATAEKQQFVGYVSVLK